MRADVPGNRAVDRRVGRRLACFGLAALLLSGIPSAADLEPPPAGVDARDVARRAEESLRGERTFLEAKMIVKPSGLSRQREVSFRYSDDRAGERTLIRILSPARDKGTAFLKLHPNLWEYVPRIERTRLIRQSMMLEPWMESDFTNDDLVNASSEIDDYDHRLLGVDTRPDGIVDLHAYVVEYTPREDVPPLWGKIISWIEVGYGTPLRREFYNADGELLRVMHFGDIREVQGRRVPHLWVVRSATEKGEESRIEIERIRFDPDFDEDLFTTRRLKQGD